MADALDLDSLTRNHARARRLARALVRSDDEADDLVQDAWVRAIERGPRDPGALGGWLATVVRRLAVNARRGGGRRRDREEEAARHEALPSSADIAARVEVEARLLRALESLAQPHRTVLRDRYLGGLEPAQMAERDGLSHEAVRSRLKRARAAMRAQLDREGLGSEQHWTLAVGPLLVPSAGTTLASGGAAATGVAGLTTLFGGELMIKKLVAVGIAVAAIGVAVWQNTGRDEVRRTALPEPQQVERLAGVEEARGPFAQAEQDARLATPDTPGQVRSRGERPDARPDEGDPWRVAGRFRTAGEDRGVAGVEFVLTMYAGMDAEGDAMGRYDLTSDADGRFAVDLERPQRSVCFDLELPPHPDREYSVDAPWRAPLGGDAPQIDILTLVRNATVEG
ncbi:MAG: sigma-70 family RNA polymerase sigma factor, partial [Planctomycetota bacterium]